ncbi:hypothetical protein ASPCAL07570 [Aspergillus calidoustus]|uniref:BZIP domain-containing protein n=1 Tax=Aspergillus calidoustus TaxID=454130 RepID=A0A0U5GUQ8_ASPCI|nr:hypothetical protein ASPCAL07570 [Aspergillus calidoustus]
MATKVIQPWQLERRREQNARAQQRSRARRKALEQALKDESPNIQLVPATRGSSHVGCKGKTACPRPQLKFGDFLHYFARPSDLDNVVKIIDAEGLNIGAVIKYGLISMGYCLDDALFNARREVCFACWASTIEPQMSGRFRIGTALLAGVQVLSRLRGPAAWYFEIDGGHVSRVPQPHAHMSAFVEIAKHIGVLVEEMAVDGAMSPFTPTRPSVPWTSPDELAALKPDIQPVPEQFTIPHHPYLDLIPFPTFRTRALLALARGDRTFSETDLCFDLMHGGLRCNGSSEVSLHGRGDGAPWDARSWEVTPWFYRKWGGLVGDESDLIYRSSAWWWARR